MVKKAEVDFLNWASFPSSLKLVNDEATWFVPIISLWIPVKPGSKIDVKVKAKSERNAPIDSTLSFLWARNVLLKDVLRIHFPSGAFQWSTFKGSFVVASDVDKIQAGFMVSPSLLWVDDLRIYQDGVLIYEDKFTGWGSLISIPAPIVAGLGVVRFGKKG